MVMVVVVSLFLRYKPFGHLFSGFKHTPAKRGFQRTDHHFPLFFQPVPWLRYRKTEPEERRPCVVVATPQRFVFVCAYLWLLFFFRSYKQTQHNLFRQSRRNVLPQIAPNDGAAHSLVTVAQVPDRLLQWQAAVHDCTRISSANVKLQTPHPQDAPSPWPVFAKTGEPNEGNLIFQTASYPFTVTRGQS